jgi:predicted TIM-barrel enzyme
MEPRLQGYVGGSSAERFPIETSVVQATREFKNVKLSKAN